MRSLHTTASFTLLLLILPLSPSSTVNTRPSLLCLRGGFPEASKEQERDVENVEASCREGAEFIKSVSRTAALSFDSNMRPVAGRPICATMEDCRKYDVMPGSLQVVPVYRNLSQVRELPGIHEGLNDFERAFLTFATEESADARHLHSLARIFEDNNVSCGSLGIFNEENEIRDEEVYRKIAQYVKDAEERGVEVEQSLDPTPNLNVPDEMDSEDPARELHSRLLSAAADGDVDKIERLLSAGAPMDPQEFQVHYSPLMHAASYGHVEACKYLIERGANVSARSFYNGTALHYAAAKGQVEVCQLLLDYGADPNSFAEWGGTPMEWALETFEIEAAKFLSGLTGDYHQLGRDHPRPWLGSDIDTFRAAAREANITLAEDGYWKRLLAAREAAKAEREARRKEKKGRKKKDPYRGEVVVPKKKVLDPSMFYSKWVGDSIKFGEFCDTKSGGLDIAMLDTSTLGDRWKDEGEENSKPRGWDS